MAVNRPVELSLDTFLVSLSNAGYDGPHNVFAGTGRYVPPSANRDIEGAAAAELAKLDLLRGGELDEEFQHSLRVLSVAHTEYFAHVRTGDAHYGVLVAVRGETAVTALSEDDRVLLKPTSERDLTRALTACLPEFPAANFRPFSARRSDLADSDDDAVDIFDDGPSTSRDAHDLRNILIPPFHGTGYLHVARRARDGPRMQADQAITYVDLEAGRVGFDITGPANNQHVTALPGDPVTLAERLSRLRRTLD